MPLETDAILNNRYRIVEILGQGGMGSIYRAIDENLGVEVAVKENFFTTEDYARQFRREATILAGLRHPNLPRVTDHFVIEGQGQYLVMDYIAGEDLRQRMDRLGTLPEEEVVKIGAAICDALSYLSACSPPVVHRDIKPGNVKIDPQGQIFLVDFGLAKIMFGSQLTTTGARAMTPGYSPPEQYGSARTDQRSDLYSLGATLYAALTGYVPEDALNRAIDQAQLTPIRKLNPRTPRRLAQVIEKSMEIRAEDRYQTADKFKEALLNSLSNTRRNKDLDYNLSPPQEINSKPATNNQSSRVGPLMAVTAGGGTTPPVASTYDIIPARPITSRPYKKQRRNGSCILWLIILIALSIVGLIAASWYNPDLPQQFLAYAGLGPARSTITPTPPVDATSLAATHTPLAAARTLTALPQQTYTPTHTPSSTSTPTATASPSPTSTPTLMPTQLGGSSGRIAYASVREKVPQIWIVDLNSKVERQITDLPEGACQPDWAPDGQWLVFISPCYRNQEAYPGAGLFLINVDDPDTQPIPIPSEPGGDYDPRWSPDGTKILFTSERATNRARLFVLNLEDRQVSLVADTFERDYQPAWSPDGKRIVFVSLNKGVNEIWIMDANGTNRQQITRSNNAVDSAPDWSPDGKNILFTQNEIGFFIPMLKAVLIGVEKPVEFLMSPVNIPMREARYSPDGLWLVFESWPEGGNHDIYIMTASGSNRQQISTNPLNDFDGTWGQVPLP